MTNTIDVLEIVNSEQYLVQGYNFDSYTEYFIDGEKAPYKTLSNGFTIGKDQKISKLNNRTELSHYQRKDEVMPIEIWKSKPKSYDQYSKEEDVLTAIANKKELEGFEPVYKDCIPELMEFNIVGCIEDTMSKFIHVKASLKYRETASYYCIHPNYIAWDEYNKLSKQYEKFGAFNNDKSRKYLRFAQVNRSYVFGEYYPYTEGASQKDFNSLEEAQAEEHKIRQGVQRIVQNKIFGKELSDDHKLNIISKLSSIKALKNKSSIYDMIDVLISELREYKDNITLNDSESK